MSFGTPAAELQIDAALVQALLAAQHPELSRLPLQEVDSGWDNAMFRLGDDLAVRLPRRAAAAPLIVREQRWLPGLAPLLPLATPAPVRVGGPMHEYPWSWSIVPWLPGLPADLHPPEPSQAIALAAFLRALHIPAPSNAPHNTVRGVPLLLRAGAAEERMHRLAETTDLMTPELHRIWADALSAPIGQSPTWLHGDLHPRNVLVEHGQISGVIDWGDINAGDPATDLAAFWMLFDDPTVRQQALAAYGGVSDALLRRTRGWALLFGVLLLATGLVDHPRHAAIGEQTLRRLLAEST